MSVRVFSSGSAEHPLVSAGLPPHMTALITQYHVILDKLSFVPHSLRGRIDPRLRHILSWPISKFAAITRRICIELSLNLIEKTYLIAPIVNCNWEGDYDGY